MTTATKTKAKAKGLKVAGVELDPLPPWAEGARDLGGSTHLRLPPEELLASPLNPRRQLDAAKVREIAVSIRMHGWRGEVLARWVGMDGAAPAKYELVSGAHRRAAALAAGLDEIRVEVCELTDLQAARFQMVENLARGDLHPLEEASGFAGMLALGDPAEAIAEHVGRPVAFVRRRLQLLQLSKLARGAFDAGHLLAGHAELLAGLQHDEQDRLVVECNLDGTSLDSGALDQPISVRDLALQIRDEVMLDLARAPWDLADATLVEAAGACAACPKRSRAGDALFPGVSTDRCADRLCHGKKLAAHLGAVKARAAARAPQGVPVLEVSSDFAGYGAKPQAGDPVPRDKWKPIGEGARCSSAQPAVVVKGDEQLGQELEVCTDPRCATHFASSAKGAAGKAGSAGDGTASEDDAAARKKAREDAKLKAAVQTITAGLVIRHVQDKASELDDLRFVARTLWRALWPDVRLVWAAWQPGAGAQVDQVTADALFADAIKPSRDSFALEAVLVGLALAQDVTHPQGDDGKAEELALAAKRHGVDAKAVMRDAQDSVAPPENPAKPGKKAGAGKASAGKKSTLREALDAGDLTPAKPGKSKAAAKPAKPGRKA